MMNNDWQMSSSYRLHNDYTRPSSPIEVPSCRRPTTSFSLSPGNWSSSSELIFDMSPLSQEYSSIRFNSIALQSAREGREHEPFLYQLPISGSRSYRPTQSDPRSQDFPQPTNNVEAPISTENYQRSTVVTAVQAEGHVGETIKDDFTVSKAAPETTKIVGFSPIIPHQIAGLQAEEHVTKKPPFPPPRRLPASPSSWILAGNSGDGDSSPPRRSSDAGMLDFKKYLLRRIDEKKFRLFTDVMAF
ncbi:hypothetical protein BDQ17DRAFT_1321221 [Cyathus striatus]|nr:hypothetical protein BDQ17DRAFT_1321221 [Cyathus striatus]